MKTKIKLDYKELCHTDEERENFLKNVIAASHFPEKFFTDVDAIGVGVEDASGARLDIKIPGDDFKAYFEKKHRENLVKTGEAVRKATGRGGADVK